MKCKRLHKRLIFFLEGDLPKEKMLQISKHLTECKECFLFAEELKKTLGIIDAEKLTEVNPYFYTRLKARMDNQVEENSTAQLQTVFTRILQPVMFSFLLMVGIYSGIKIGQAPQTKNVAQTFDNQKMIPYLNEMSDEPIEAFLME
jgi:anti-sigma factor RsiW